MPQIVWPWSKKMSKGTDSQKDKGKWGKQRVRGRTSSLQPHLANPKDPAVLKILRDSELLRRSVSTVPPPRLLRCEPLFEGKDACKSRKIGSAQGGGRHSKLLCDSNYRQEAYITWCDLFRPKFGPKTPRIITSHDVLEPLKQVLSASRDVIISGQICGSKLQTFFTLGDGCWLPK